MHFPKSRSFLTLLGVVALVLPATLLAQSILDNAARPDEERERDSGSKPLEVYSFFGVESGMTVVDLMPGGGYNTFILSKLVGDHGAIYAGPDRRGNLAPRVEADGLSDVTVIADFGGVEGGTADVAISVRNFHDLEGGGNATAAYGQFFAMLKAGGVLGVVDARTNKDDYDEGTHRINEQVIIDHVTAAGFELVEKSEMLANPDDDFGKWEGMSGRMNTDRMVLKFRKPAM